MGLASVTQHGFEAPPPYTLVNAERGALWAHATFYIQPCRRAMQATWFVFLSWWPTHVSHESSLAECQVSPSVLLKMVLHGTWTNISPCILPVASII